MEDFQTQGSVLKGSRNARLLITESLQHNLFQQMSKDMASSERPWERHLPSHARGGTRADGSAELIGLQSDTSQLQFSEKSQHY